MSRKSNRLRVAALAAIDAWGQAPQLRMVQEECAELIAALNQLDRGRVGVEKIAEETADVYITLEFIRCALGDRLVDEAIEKKLSRLERRISDDPSDEVSR